MLCSIGLYSCVLATDTSLEFGLADSNGDLDLEAAGDLDGSPPFDSEDTPPADADGDESMEDPDGPVADDGAEDDGSAVGPVRITLQDAEGSPLEGTPVVFHDPSGSPLETVLTDADGLAQADIMSGGSVSLLVEQAGTRQVYSLMGVQPEDVILVRPPQQPGNTALGSISVTLSGPMDLADVYQVHSGCENLTDTDPGRTFILAISDSCSADGSTADLLAVAEGDGNPLAYAGLSGIALESGGVTVAAFGAWQTVLGSLDLTLSAEPPDMSMISTRLRLLDGTVAMREGGSYLAESIAEGGQTALFDDLPMGPIDTYELDTTITYSIAENLAAMSRMVYRLAPTSSLTLDPLVDFLPAIDSVSLDTTDFTRPSMEWTLTGELVEADGALLEFSWTIDPNKYKWTILAPPDVVSPMRVPELPAEYSDWLPTAEAQFSATMVSFFSSDQISSYGDVRAYPMALQFNSPLATREGLFLLARSTAR